MHRPALSMKCNGDAKCLVTAIENQAGEQPKPNPKQLIGNPSTARKDAQSAYFSFALESYICYECRSYCENTYLWELGIHGRMARSSWMRCIHLEASWVLIYRELHKMETGNEGLVCILFFCWTPIRQSQNRYIYNFWMGSWGPHVEDEHSVRNFRQNAYTACQTSTISSQHPDENLFERNIQMFSDIWIPFLTTFPTKQPEKIHQDEPSIGILSPSTIRRAVAGFVGKAVQSSCWRRIGGSRISWITLGGQMHFWYWK